MRPTWILVLVQSLHLINLQLLRKTDKASLPSGGELLVSALMNNSIQNFHHNYSLINNYLQIAFQSAAFPLALQRENVFLPTKWVSTRIPKDWSQELLKI